MSLKYVVQLLNNTVKYYVFKKINNVLKMLKKKKTIGIYDLGPKCKLLMNCFTYNLQNKM